VQVQAAGNEAAQTASQDIEPAFRLLRGVAEERQGEGEFVAKQHLGSEGFAAFLENQEKLLLSKPAALRRHAK